VIKYDVPVMSQVVLVGPDMCRPQALRWGVKVLRKFGDALEVAADGIGSIVPEL
jgi:hypothetical protein